MITDLGSANGTFVLNPGDSQWTRLVTNQPVRLEPGGRIAIGGHRNRLRGPASNVRPAVQAGIGGRWHNRHVAIDRRRAFIEAATLTASVIGTPEVAARWTAPSALAELSVGGLAGHAYLAARIVWRSLDEPDPTGLPVGSPSAGGLVSMRVNCDSDLMRDDHRRVRTDGEYVARRGAAAVAEKFQVLTARLRVRLPIEPADRLVRAPSGNVAYRLDDWVANRTVEMLVHADDVAVSAGLDPVVLPADAAQLAIETLVDLSRQREGDLTVLRALSGLRERQPADALRAL